MALQHINNQETSEEEVSNAPEIENGHCLNALNCPPGMGACAGCMYHVATDYDEEAKTYLRKKARLEQEKLIADIRVMQAIVKQKRGGYDRLPILASEIDRLINNIAITQTKLGENIIEEELYE